MVAIKKRKSKAYILWESLVALGVFSLIATSLLVAIDQGRQLQEQAILEQDILQVAKMAVQTKRDKLSLNGQTVTVERTADKIAIYHQGEQVLYVEKD